MIDGACAAMLHLTQSDKVKDYYKNRHMRLKSTSDFTTLRQTRDKFLQVSLNQSLVAPDLNLRK